MYILCRRKYVLLYGHNGTWCSFEGESPVREGGECDTRVEDGKLVYERRWYHRGQSVYVEGRDMPRFPAYIHAITDDAVRLIEYLIQIDWSFMCFEAHAVLS